MDCEINDNRLGNKRISTVLADISEEKSNKKIRNNSNLNENMLISIHDDEDDGKQTNNSTTTVEKQYTIKTKEKLIRLLPKLEDLTSTVNQINILNDESTNLNDINENEHEHNEQNNEKTVASSEDWRRLAALAFHTMELMRKNFEQMSTNH